MKNICRKYSSRKINEEELKFCLYSITDNNNFLNANSLPIEKMITFLKQYFDPDDVEGKKLDSCHVFIPYQKGTIYPFPLETMVLDSVMTTAHNTNTSCSPSNSGKRSWTTCSCCGVWPKMICSTKSTRTILRTQDRVQLIGCQN